jgi:dienelactone hydrolase
MVAGFALNEATERAVIFRAKDGWQISASLFVPKAKGRVPGVVLVPGSSHEKDAYGQVATPGLTSSVTRRGIATLRIDIRGRGASREPRIFHSMSPAERDGVRLDTRAAIDYLGEQSGIDAARIAIAAEQDSAGAAILAGAKDRKVAACVLISGRVDSRAIDAVGKGGAPIFCLVSKEDRRGFGDMLAVYLASGSRHSRIKVFEGLALGTTMFSTWRNEFPEEEPIEEMLGAWLSQRLCKKSK